MAEYDDTNKGVSFQPYDNQQLRGSGKLNVEGNEHKIVLIREPVSRDGEPVLVVYQRMGVLFPNESDNEAAPQFSGPLDAHKNKKVAAWLNETSDGRKYLSLKVSEKQGGGGGGGERSEAQRGGFNDDLDGDIPF